MITLRRTGLPRTLWAAVIVGGIGTLAESFIGTATLVSGFTFGWFDIAGTGLGLLALAAVWRWPAAAAVLWLATLPLLWHGGLLVSVACLPVLLFPPTAAGLALWPRWQSR
jgi:hypothetical protein